MINHNHKIYAETQVHEKTKCNNSIIIIINTDKGTLK